MGSVTSVATNWGQIFELDIGEQNMCVTRNAAASYLLGSQQFNQSFSPNFQPILVVECFKNYSSYFTKII